MQGIMASLKEEDEMVQEAALNELTELMSMSSEESLTVLPLEQLVPQLVSYFATASLGHTSLYLTSLLHKNESTDRARAVAMLHCLQVLATEH